MEKEKKKKSRKKIGVIILIVILIIILLLCLVQCQSCSGDADPTGNTTAPTGEPTTEGTGNSEPSTEATTPGEDVTEPSGEATEPSTAPSEPSTDTTEPSTDTTEPSGHIHSYTKTKTAPGCETEGYTTYTCDCGDTFTGDNVPATGHEWGEWVTTKEATTSTTGTAERTCTACGSKESKTLDKLVAGHTHSYSGEVTTAATCSKEGVKTFTCSCGSTYTEAIAKTAHSYKSTVTAPTCTAKGYTTYKCSSCGDTYKADYKDAKGHSYTSKVTKAATCTAEGTKTFTCSCGSSYTEKIAKAAHKYVDTVTKPTCTKDGYTTHKCSVCGNSYTDAKKAATGHSYTSKVTTPATCTKDGVKTYTCSKCSHSYTEAVKGKHNWKHVNEIPADCEEAIDCECGISATYAWAEAYGCDTLEETLYEMHKEWYGDGDLANEHNHERVVIRVYLVCGHDGWKCTEYEAEQAGFGVGFDAAINYYHNHAKTTGKFTDHSYHTEREYVDVDGYDVCTECGAKK